jgi:hypothetical protein
MKINAPETGRKPLSFINNGEVFRYEGNFYIRTNGTLHVKNDPDVVFGVKLEDGILTQFGKHTLVTPIDGEFDVK